MRPRESQGVLLNEPLDFFFSAPIDRSSVTSGLRVVDAGGQPARGELEVDGDHVRFLPAPVLSADLEGGGFRPGEDYAVELVGFPRPDALRDADGRPLDRTQRWWFRTQERGAGPLFADDTPDRSATLLLLTPVVGPDDPLVLLAHDEPLDPTSVRAEDFWLVPDSGSERGERVPLRARLVRELASERELRPSPSLVRVGEGRFGVDPRRASLLELQPRRTLPPGTYKLGWKAELPLTDLGGNPVRIARDSRAPELSIEVLESLGRRREGEHLESFLGPEQSWREVPVPGVDGTAYWRDTGRVEIRYPAAAGDGRHGLVVLGETEGRRDLAATRLELFAGRTCTLDAAPGLVVLRSQGRMHLAGDLVRSVRTPNAGGGVDGEDPGQGEGEDGGEPDFVPRIDPGFDGSSLSTWLARTAAAAEAGGPSWTVLVAGGDLIVEGTIDVDTPLLLVAGGMTWVGASGAVAGPYRHCWILGEGRGPRMFLTRDADPVELAVDPPAENPLVEPLRFAVFSAPYPPTGGVRHWKAARVHGRQNFGAFQVRYLAEDVPLSASPVAAVLDPRSLDGPTRMRMLLQLDVMPYDPRRFPAVLDRRWNPPFIDYVILSWD